MFSTLNGTLEMKPEQKETPSAYANTYVHAYTLTNLRVSLGFPLDRLKTQLQADTHLPAPKVTLNTIRGGFGELYAGLLPALMRENIKPLYRTMLTTKLPHTLNETLYQPYHFHPVSQAVTTAAIASNMDLAITTPLEVLKVKKMTHSKQPIATLLRQQMKTSPKGFFSGYGASFLKSYPAWCNLFLVKQAVNHAQKNKSKPVSYSTLATFSMFSAAPLTLATTPFDVIKTKHQMREAGKKQDVTLFQTAKDIVQKDGFTKLLRGFTPRLAHRFMGVFTGLLVMDAYEKYSENPSNTI